MNAHTVEAGQIQAYGRLPAPQVTPELWGLVKTGQVYSLAVVVEEGIIVPGAITPYTLSPRLRHGDLDALHPASAAAETLNLAIHTGTHIDALCHIGEHQNAQGEPDASGPVYLYGGVRADDSASHQGQRHLGIEHMPPIVTRAVLLDVAGQKNVPVLPDGYIITRADIEAALAAQGTVMRPGTAVLVRTGFYHHLRAGNRVYRDAVAGIGLEAARYLFEQGMILAGADNMTVEAMPPADHAVHRFLLVHHGVTHMENLFLEALAADRVFEFLLIVTPLRLRGATGSWVHPIAIA